MQIHIVPLNPSHIAPWHACEFSLLMFDGAKEKMFLLKQSHFFFCMKVLDGAQPTPEPTPPPTPDPTPDPTPELTPQPTPDPTPEDDNNGGDDNDDDNDVG